MSDDSLDDHMKRLAAVRPRLVSFARLHLRDPVQAEDAVQEALMAAIEKDATFKGESGYETWEFGILKYNILDAMRAQKRQGLWQPLEGETGDEALERQFQQNGRWREDMRPLGWGEPETVFEDEQAGVYAEALLDGLGFCQPHSRCLRLGEHDGGRCTQVQGGLASRHVDGGPATPPAAT